MIKINIYKLISYLLLLAIIIFSNQITYASWVYLSADELIEQSDCIIIGEVVGRSGQTSDVIAQIMWEFKVDYCLKGEIRDQMITVTTPSENLSIHYNLDDWGKRVMLFVCKAEDYYSPLSPQGVIPISSSNDLPKNLDYISGEELLNYININDSNVDNGKLQKYIKSVNVYSPIESQYQQNDTSDNINNNSLLYLYFVVGIGIIIILFMTSRNKRKMKDSHI